MNSVYFPAHVVLVLRRIVNVISSLSISNQYILLKQAQADEERSRLNFKIPSQRVLNLPVREWSQWKSLSGWDWSRVSSSINADPGSNQLGSRWSWAALLSTFTQVEVPLHQEVPPPPKSQKNERPQIKLPPPEPTQAPTLPDTIHQLMQNPTLYNPLRSPRYPIVLCHGLYGFDSRGPLKFPSMRMHYWSNVLNILRDTVGAEVIVTSVPGTGSIISRAEILDRQLQHKARGRGINFLAHSMGGLDCRHLITHIKPEVYAPLSLTTISTPHRGSPFMDWCAEYLGLGKRLDNEYLEQVPPPPPPKDAPFSLSLSGFPSSFTTLLLSLVDSPAYANLTSNYLNRIFNPRTPNDPTVKYFSVAGRMGGVNIWHPFWLPKMVLDGVEEKHRAKLRAIWEEELNPLGDTPLWAQEREWGNDGLVTVQSARWDWEMRGARGIEFGVDLPAIPAIGLGVSTAGHRAPAGDGWGLPEWTRFVGAWKKEQKMMQADAVEKAAGEMPTETKKPVTREEERKLERERDDAIVKSSTDKLSAVVDWLTEQVPTPALTGGKDKTDATKDVMDESPRSMMQKRMDQEGKARMKNELASKKDLERFYVALSRKLYDEGL
ncbi:hypothetical protein H0H87_010062 [Tephrocybe sp. NHM501043]|nr:hypothetical protein H0H87_010062 [Tephrocybe sp. NHM501043]